MDSMQVQDTATGGNNNFASVGFGMLNWNTIYYLYRFPLDHVAGLFSSWMKIVK